MAASARGDLDGGRQRLMWNSPAQLSVVHRPLSEYHELFNGIILPTNSSQARAKLQCELGIVASGPGLPSKAGIAQPPSPRSSGRAGPAYQGSEIRSQGIRKSDPDA